MTKSFVLYRQPYEGKATIIYVGSDKAAALDALLTFKDYCQLDEIFIVEENEKIND